MKHRITERLQSLAPGESVEFVTRVRTPNPDGGRTPARLHDRLFVNDALCGASYRDIDTSYTSGTQPHVGNEREAMRELADDVVAAERAVRETHPTRRHQAGQRIERSFSTPMDGEFLGVYSTVSVTVYREQ